MRLHPAAPHPHRLAAATRFRRAASLLLLGTILASSPTGVAAQVAAPRGEGWTHLERGAALEETFLPGEAAAAYRAALAAFRTAGDSVGLSEAHGTLGLLHLGQSRFDSAIVHHTAALQLREALADSAAMGRSLNNLGVSHYQWGNYEEALRFYLRSLEVRQALGDTVGSVRVQNNIGRTYQDWGSLDRAQTTLEVALESARAAGDPGMLGYTLHNLGMVLIDREEWTRARAAMEESLEYYRRLPDPSGGEALNLSALARIDVLEGDFERGVARLEEVRAAAVRDRAPRREARALLYLGEAYLGRGELAAAEEKLDAALSLYAGMDQPVLANEARALLATLYERRGDPARALRMHRTHDAIRDSIFDNAAGLRLAAMEARAEARRNEEENAALRAEGELREAVISRQRVITLLQGALLLATVVLAGALVWVNRSRHREARTLASANTVLEERNRELNAALHEVRTLRGLIPICSSCKKVRDDEGFWKQVETYVTEHSHATFSHGICPECGPRYFGEYWLEEEHPDAGADGTPAAVDEG